MQRILNLSVGIKLFAILLIMSLFSIGSNLYSAFSMLQIDSGYQQANSHTGMSAISSTRGIRRLVTARLAITELIISRSSADSERAIKDLAFNRDEMLKYFNQAADANPGLGDAYRGLAKKADTILTENCAKAISLASASLDGANASLAQREYTSHCAPEFNAVLDELSAVSTATFKKAGETNALLKETTTSAISSAFIILVAGLIITLIVATLMIQRSITRPLRELATKMSKLADRDYSIDVDTHGRGDEIGLMMQSVAVFKEQGLQLQAVARDEALEGQRREQERAQTDLQQSQSVERQTLVVDAIGSGLRSLADGDLSCRLLTAFDAHYEPLRKDFNTAMDRLSSALSSVAQTTGTIHAGSGEIAGAADDLSRRTEQQAASLEETAAALNELTTAIQSTAGGAAEAEGFVATARETAEHSGEVVRRAVKAMGDIEQSSQQIGQIIGVIDEIAFQTNLLALNAGVEAARAGESGRGFAVVAQEVRALAQRSADAAKEIKSLISASRDQVEQGVDLVAQTGKALDQIVAQVNQINGIVGEIASSTKEQANGLQEVNTAVNSMDRIVQQNAAMVQESTAASQQLVQDAETLTALLSRFRLAESGRGAASRAALSAGPGAIKHAASKTSAAPLTKPVAPRPAETQNRPVAALKQVGRGGAAPATKAQPSLSTDNWDEF